MLPNRGGGQQRDPPAWDTANERYSFDTWTLDLHAWRVLVNDRMDTSQQAAAIRLSLRGAAADMYRAMTIQERVQGGVINGVQVDLVTYLRVHFFSRFAPLGEEQRLMAQNDLINFDRQTGESIDALITRFIAIRSRAQAGGRIAMTWEGYAHLLQRACRVNPQHMVSIFQNLGDMLPTTG